MAAEIVIVIFAGMMLSAGLGYLLGWLRGHDIATSRAHAVYEASLCEALRCRP